MTSPTQARGFQAEDWAARFLQQQGLSLMQRNYRCRLGEIDLIMQDQPDELVFVEVRYRKQAQHGDASESVTPTKQRRLILAAEHFLLKNPQYTDRYTRFDVLGLNGQSAKPDWIKNAFCVE
ncbi:MAG: UPF0102 protein [marine bacterium B5-7]|nr:MAG: UPF0102 protein [marine bacterium B5-7]